MHHLESTRRSTQIIHTTRYIGNQRRFCTTNINESNSETLFSLQCVEKGCIGGFPIQIEPLLTSLIEFGLNKTHVFGPEMEVIAKKFVNLERLYLKDAHTDDILPFIRQ